MLDAKRDYVELYGLDSAFWPNRMMADWQPVVDQLKMHLTDLATYDHAKAQAEDDAAAYDRAARAAQDVFQHGATAQNLTKLAMLRPKPPPTSDRVSP